MLEIRVRIFVRLRDQIHHMLPKLHRGSITRNRELTAVDLKPRIEASSSEVNIGILHGDFVIFKQRDLAWLRRGNSAGYESCRLRDVVARSSGA